MTSDREADHWLEYWRHRTHGQHRTREPADMRRRAREQLLHFEGGASLFDLGCGAGEILEHLSGSFSQVVGCDGSPAMLAAARERLGERVELFVADDRAAFTKLNERRFDRISAAGVVQYLPPQRLAELIAAAARHLAPGGMIALFDIVDPRLYPLFTDGSLDDMPPPFWRRVRRRWGARLRRLRGWLDGQPDAIGRAYLPGDIAAVAPAGLPIRFPRSAYSEYRYHALIGGP